jgi:retron-type reverse transcriptase
MPTCVFRIDQIRLKSTSPRIKPDSRDIFKQNDMGKYSKKAQDKIEEAYRASPAARVVRDVAGTDQARPGG